MPFKNPFYYTDPFEDTTANLGLPGDTVAEKPVQGNVGISPITTQGAVSIPENTEPQLTSEQKLALEMQDKFSYLSEPLQQQLSNLGVDYTFDFSKVKPFTNEFRVAENLYDQVLSNLPADVSIKDINDIRKSLGVSQSQGWSPLGTVTTGRMGINFSDNEIKEFQDLTSKYATNLSKLGEDRSASDISKALGRSANITINPELTVTDRARSKYGLELSDQDYQTYNAILQDIVKETVRKNTNIPYEQAVEIALFKSPAVATLNAAFGLDQRAGTRSTGDGSMYVLDPLTGKELRTLEVKDQRLVEGIFQAIPDIATAVMSVVAPPVGATMAAITATGRGGDLEDAAKAAVGAYIGGQAFGGEGMFANIGASVAPAATTATQTAISTGMASGISSAIQGGDAGDILKSAVLGGAGGYLKGLKADVADFDMAKAAALDAGDIDTAMGYALQAQDAAAKLDLANTLINVPRAVDALASGDYTSALNFGLDAAGVDINKWTEDRLVQTFGANAFDSLNVDDVAVGVNKVATSLMDGKDFDAALQAGIKEYVQNGGSLGAAGDKVKEMLREGGRAFYEGVIKPLGDVFEGMQLTASSFDTPESIKAVEDYVREQGSLVEDVVRAGGAFVDEEVLQPTKELVESIYEPLPNPSFDAPNVNLEVNTPEFDLPEFDLPDVNLPDINLPSLDYEVAPEGRRVARTSEDLKGTNIPRIQQVTPAELFGYTDYLNQ